MYLRGQISIESLLLFLIILTIVSLIFFNVNERLEKNTTFFKNKLCDYYERKILGLANTVCSLEQGTAIKASFSKDIMNCNLDNQVMNKESKCKIMLEELSQQTNINNKIYVWIIKEDANTVKIIQAT
ncbi:MAG: hypothetical protein QXJ06_00840 [Candidatus Aenigmatarchaeota archaeon]